MIRHGLNCAIQISVTLQDVQRCRGVIANIEERIASLLSGIEFELKGTFSTLRLLLIVD